MRIAKVLGAVTLCRCHATFVGASLKLVVPLTLADLASGQPGEGESLVAWDDFAAGVGALVAISEGGEAAQPFRPLDKPVDAYCAAILDQIELHRA